MVRMAVMTMTLRRKHRPRNTRSCGLGATNAHQNFHGAYVCLS